MIYFVGRPKGVVGRFQGVLLVPPGIAAGKWRGGGVTALDRGGRI